nr:RnfABCDGE type electron transport complex subunit B [uncultured Treponema sp.]
MWTIIYTVIVSFVIALILGLCLGIFQRLFFVPVDEKVAKIRACLSGGNCGGCGFAGCDDFAKAVAEGRAEPNGCTAGGPSCAKAIGEVLGVAVEAQAKVSVLACKGTKDCAKDRGTYTGLKSCAAAKISVNGTKMCAFGCIGFGDCVASCTFDAIKMGEDGLPVIDYSKCTGCSKCVKACPNRLLNLVTVDTKGPVALCSNRSTDKPSIMKKCKNGCIKCGKCERSCTAGALKLVNGLPVIDYTKCTNCGECVKGCPTHVLAFVELTK